MLRLMPCAFAAALGALLTACTADLGNCDVDPTADCFKGKGGSSSGVAAGGGTGSGGCDCNIDPLCGKCKGAGCLDSSECQSGLFCADGVCCETECSGACVGCSKMLTG